MKHYEPKTDQISRSGRYVGHAVKSGAGDGDQTAYEKGWDRIFGTRRDPRKLGSKIKKENT